MSQVEQTPDEIIDSLTGHDEMELSAQFGATIGQLVSNQSMLRRACVFIVKRREGLNDDDARNFALGMILKDVLEFFASESVESGKDETAVEQKPQLSPTGVSELDEPVTSS